MLCSYTESIHKTVLKQKKRERMSRHHKCINGRLLDPTFFTHAKKQRSTNYTSICAASISMCIEWTFNEIEGARHFIRTHTRT